MEPENLLPDFEAVSAPPSSARTQDLDRGASVSRETRARLHRVVAEQRADSLDVPGTQNSDVLATIEQINFPKPGTPRIIACASSQTGSGKSSTVAHLATALASRNLKVLVIDLDPKATVTGLLGFDPAVRGRSTKAVLRGEVHLIDIIRTSEEFANLTCVPAGGSLAGVEVDLLYSVAGEYKLKKALGDYLAHLANHELPQPDYILIDCPPSLGLLTLNALCVAHELLVPFGEHGYYLHLQELWTVTRIVHSNFNPDLRFLGLEVDAPGRGIVSASTSVMDPAGMVGLEVLEAKAPSGSEVLNALSFGQTVITYAPSSQAALDYYRIAQEITKKIVNN